MNVFLLLAVLLIGILFDASAFTIKSAALTGVRFISRSDVSRVRGEQSLFSVQSVRNDQKSIIALFHSAEGTEGEPYLQHVCPSCSYIYDEAKGFKKRHPPGTRLKDIPVFMCPVCGAAKDQFQVVPKTE